jgi:20S proteasome alpha/beta subunit
MTCLTLIRYPYVTGASVLAIKYKDGVLIACDMLGVSRSLMNTPLKAQKCGSIKYCDGH